MFLSPSLLIYGVSNVMLYDNPEKVNTVQFTVKPSKLHILDSDCTWYLYLISMKSIPVRLEPDPKSLGSSSQRSRQSITDIHQPCPTSAQYQPWPATNVPRTVCSYKTTVNVSFTTAYWQRRSQRVDEDGGPSERGDKMAWIPPLYYQY